MSSDIAASCGRICAACRKDLSAAKHSCVTAFRLGYRGAQVLVSRVGDEGTNMTRAADPSSSGTALEPFRKRQHASCIVVGVVDNGKAKRVFQAPVSDDASRIARCVSACVPALSHWKVSSILVNLPSTLAK